jgi:oligopeptide/dipeptide ABC transporter ATP-binding protein
MYVGRIVETASTEALFATPRHPYTEALLSAVPKPDPRLRSDRIVLQGEVADPANAPPGCHSIRDASTPGRLPRKDTGGTGDCAQPFRALSSGERALAARRCDEADSQPTPSIP